MYSKLEEPDGLGGLLRLRQGGPCLQDQILAAEKAGRWPEALTLYEQVGCLRGSGARLCTCLQLYSVKVKVQGGQPGASCLCAQLRGCRPVTCQVLYRCSNGQWTSALDSKSQLRPVQALRSEQPGDTAAQDRAHLSQARQGHLRCLLHMGQHHSLLAQVDGWALACSGLNALLSFSCLQILTARDGEMMPRHYS